MLIVLFAGRSILVSLDFHQLPGVRGMPVYASSLDADHPESYIANDLWRMFSFVELTEDMHQKRDKHFIEFLKKVRVEKVDSEIVRTLKSIIVCSSQLYNSKHSLHVFAENVPVFNHDNIMLD